MHQSLKYITGYPANLIEQVSGLVESNRFITWFEQRYPDTHQIKSEKALFDYTMQIKQRFMKKTAPITKVVWDSKIHLINNALGLHTYVSRVHGGKLKAKNEIRIASIFKDAPEPLLRMLVVHELAHVREKEHDKGFYQLCCHMEPNYHQLEFDARLFMIYKELMNENAKNVNKNTAEELQTTPVIEKRAAAGLHKNNRHHGRYDFDVLVNVVPALKAVMTKNPNGEDTISFSDPLSVKLLNKALLMSEYGVEFWDIPEGFLCPPIPGRADYIHWLSEHLNRDLAKPGAKIKVRALDVGVGANCIYPIIGASQYHWNWVGSEIDASAIEAARHIVDNNPSLAKKIDIRQQANPDTIFEGVIHPGDFFVVTTCNPPFHKSLEEAKQGSERKVKNLGQNRQQRGSNAASVETSALNFGGQKAELWCPGGEAAFVAKMAQESERFSKQVIWFSTLLSKKDNIRPLTKKLAQLGATEIVIQEMAQGQKKSRFVAWSFMSTQQRSQFAKTLK